MEIFLSGLLIMISILAHELAHGYMAAYCGDDTAERMGRLSLNPLNHLDLWGTVIPILLYIMNTSFVFGWAKPVPINYYNLKYGKMGRFLVSIAGVLMNFFFVFFGAVLLKLEILNSNVLVEFIKVNISLAIFNILPIPPLDGFRIVEIFSDKISNPKYDLIGMGIIVILSYTGLLSQILDPLYSGVIKLVAMIVGS